METQAHGRGFVDTVQRSGMAEMGPTMGSQHTKQIIIILYKKNNFVTSFILLLLLLYFLLLLLFFCYFTVFTLNYFQT